MPVRGTQGHHMVDRDNGQHTTALVAAMWAVLLALVRGACHFLVTGGQIAQPPTLTTPPHCAHTAVEVA